MRKILHKDCEFCNKSFDTTDNRKRFCSISCATKKHNSQRGPMSVEHRLNLSNSLKLVYKTLPKRPYVLALNYAKAYTKGKYKNPKSLLDLSKRTISKICRRMNKGCSKCGWNETICDIHHIRGRKIPDPHSHSNLTYLCPNCHRLAHEKILAVDELIPISIYFGNEWLKYYYG